MSIPRPDERSKAFFQSIIPDDPRVRVRPMFGNLAAFVDGNMFMGLYGGDVFIRLPDRDRQELLKEGGSTFEPMKGRPMKEYVTVPKAWHENPAKVHGWVARSLTWVGEMPAKKKRTTKK